MMMCVDFLRREKNPANFCIFLFFSTLFLEREREREEEEEEKRVFCVVVVIKQKEGVVIVVSD